MMAAGAGTDLLDSAQPVLGTPPAGVGRINRYHGQTGVGGHLDQTVAEACGRNARHCSPECAPAPSPRRQPSGSFPSFVTGLAEVEILDHHRCATVRMSESEQLRYRRSQPAVTRSRPPSS
jgi:hypothetical protein